MTTTNRISLILWALSLAFALEASAQSQYDNFKKLSAQRFEQYKHKSKEQFENYRRKVNDDFASYLEKPWKNVDSEPPIKQPKEDTPIVPPKPIKEDLPIKDDKIIINEVVKPVPDAEPRPEPVEPIHVSPQPLESYHDFVCYGTPMRVRIGKEHKFKLDGIDNKSISRAWKLLSDKQYDAVIADCIALRSKHNLSDWHYLKMLKQMSQSLLGNTNEAVLLMAYIYSQSGYKMRLASSAGKLKLCYASKHLIYNQTYYKLDGFNYYTLDGNGESIRMSDASFPNEKPMSLYISNAPILSHKPSPSRNLKSNKYPTMEFDIVVNQNLIALYNDYPSSEIGGDFMTRWAMYASSPISTHIRKNLYPIIKKKISNKSEFEAVQMILNWIQTGFKYEYDTNVWGDDRAFFSDETLFYPYCDCEDRAILFSRLVRDILDLEVILVYYPGHLATAVHFSDENIHGDYVTLAGKRFHICDPTYINANVGQTMPDLKNCDVKVILLPK